MDTKVIGKRIRELRHDNNLSQAALGKLLNLSQDTISFWETGKGLPSVNDIIRIVEIFSKENDRITADYLLGLSEI